jgi:hypothetical protein
MVPVVVIVAIATAAFAGNAPEPAARMAWVFGMGRHEYRTMMQRVKAHFACIRNHRQAAAAGQGDASGGARRWSASNGTRRPCAPLRANRNRRVRRLHARTRNGHAMRKRAFDDPLQVPACVGRVAGMDLQWYAGAGPRPS